jgi:hypothetical protein
VDLYIHSPIRLHVVVLNQLSKGTTFLLHLVEAGYVAGKSKEYAASIFRVESIFYVL